MIFPQVTIGSNSATATSKNVSLLVLQPRGQLDLETSSDFQVLLEKALRQSAATVVVDLIGVTLIDAAGREALKTGVSLAFALGKELVIWSANAVTRATLKMESDRQQSQQFGNRTEVIHPDFQQFLSCLSNRQNQPVSLKSAPQTPPSSVKLSSATPVLAASSYTSGSWCAYPPVGHIA